GGGRHGSRTAHPDCRTGGIVTRFHPYRTGPRARSRRSEYSVAGTDTHAGRRSAWQRRERAGRWKPRRRTRRCHGWGGSWHGFGHRNRARPCQERRRCLAWHWGKYEELSEKITERMSEGIYGLVCKKLAPHCFDDRVTPARGCGGTLLFVRKQTG